MRLEQRPAVGSVVYLRPTSRTAPREAYSLIPVTVVDYETWPMVKVRVEIKGADPYELSVHADNCALNPPRRVSAGDGPGGDLRGPRTPRKTPGRYDVVLGPGDEEMTLW